MPKAIKVITITNIILVVLFIGNMMLLQKSQLAYPVASYINLVTIGTLLVVIMIIIFRATTLVGFARLLIYVLALALGLQLLLTLKYLFTVYGIVTVLFDVIIVIYAIGLRGYLASEQAKQYFTGQNS